LETAATAQSTNHRTTQPTNQPAIQPTNQPTTQPSNQQTANPQSPNIHRAIAAAERAAPAEPALASDSPVRRAPVEGEDEDDDDFNLPALFDEAPGPSEAQERDSRMEMNQEADNPQVDVDIEELAQRVYSTLRRRLTVDWERERGRR
jgi:hypothetical protein